MPIHLLKEDGYKLLKQDGGALLIDNSELRIEINTEDRTDVIDWQSFRKTEVLTKEPDTFEFLIKNYPTKNYCPALGDTVVVDVGGVNIFAGVVVEIDNTVNGLLNYNRILCKDYTHIADQLLVSKTYTSQTVDYIVKDIIATYCPTFTTTNVVGATGITIDNIAFNYVTVNAAIQKLISIAGANFDYYFDYSKDLHFFPSDYVSAPFSITDSTANFDWQSLKINTDLSQLRNRITVRGGYTAGTAVTSLKVADGKQVQFFVGYSLGDILVYKALAASPTSFVAKTVGADGKDDPTLFDCLYNPDRGFLIFPDASKPAVNDVIKFTGTPAFSIIVQKQDNASISQYGMYEQLVIDKTIISKATARSRATAELLKYSQPLITGSFNTRTYGLMAGQTLLINSTLRSINNSYKIQRITTTLHTPSEDAARFMYNVEFVTTQSLTINDVLKKLLITDQTDQIAVGQNEIVDTVYSALEEIGIVENVNVSVNTTNDETITVAETVTPQALDYAVEFCFDVDTPTGTKRGFVWDGSPLG